MMRLLAFESAAFARHARTVDQGDIVSAGKYEIAMEVATELMKQIAISSVPFGIAIARTVENSSKEIDAASDRGIEDLRQELAKQELKLDFDLKKAKIAQELAIAQRITNAEVVEIEEFYDRSGSGQAGLGVSESSFNLGVKGDGKSVVKRVYKFTGHNAPTLDVTRQIEGNEVDERAEPEA